MQSSEHSLEVLPAMLNLVLLQTSKILRDPNCQNIRHAGLTRTRITGIVNSANQRFHEALDEIEVEILQAKAVMERDLRNIRKKRAERDRARDRANGIPSPSALAKEVEETAHQADGLLAESTFAGQDLPHVQALDGGKGPSLEEHGGPNAKIDESKVVGVGQGMPQDSENSAGLAITMPSDPDSKAQDQPKNDEQQPADEMDASEIMMDTSNAAGVDFFESMFNDDLVSGDNEINIGDFNFSMDTNTSQTLDSDNTLQNSATTHVDLNNMVSTSNEDINSLLPGLENYVTGSDFSNVGMPATSAQPESSQGAAPAVASSTSAPDATGTTAVNTSLNDSFFDFNFDMNNAGGDEMGDGTLADFEDFDWT